MIAILLIPILFLLLRNKISSPKKFNLLLTPDGERIKKQWGYLTGIASIKHGIPENIIIGTIGNESDGNQNAKGSFNEIGLMQLLPAGALLDYEEKFGKQFNPSFPGSNIEIGSWYLAEINRNFPLDEWKDKIQAYQQGISGYKKGKRNFEYANRTNKYVTILS